VTSDHATRRHQKGQAVLLVVLALSLVLIAMLGLSMDGGLMYTNFQKAQAAADAAAQAGIMSIYNGTNTGASNTFGGGSFTCGLADTKTPCVYARMNGFGATASDSVSVAFSGGTCSAPGVTLSSDPVNLICVTVARTVNTSFIRILGQNTSTVSALGIAAISVAPSPIPIVVTHPTMSGSLSDGGSSNITIQGGPQRSIQVNSSSTTAAQVSSVDLSAAGPAGTGGDFGVWGGPATKPGGINIGTTGHYIFPASPIQDPLASVSPPSVPAVAKASISVASGVDGCLSSTCTLYYPGLYTADINVKGETALFSPGIYYLNGANFTGAANGLVEMATGLTDGSTGTNTGWTENMLVYLTGPGNPAATGTLSFGANFGKKGSSFLIGSPNASAYEGILFFVDRNAAANAHNLGGGGSLTLGHTLASGTPEGGTFYATNSLATMTANSSHYQSISLGGGSGSSTLIYGEIITGAISLGGNSSITMVLNPVKVNSVRQVALVQ
jgi:hypothetical protein